MYFLFSSFHYSLIFPLHMDFLLFILTGVTSQNKCMKQERSISFRCMVLSVLSLLGYLSLGLHCVAPVCRTTWGICTTVKDFQCHPSLTQFVCVVPGNAVADFCPVSNWRERVSGPKGGDGPACGAYQWPLHHLQLVSHSLHIWLRESGWVGRFLPWFLCGSCDTPTWWYDSFFLC
jgi:hypothetical protein